MMHIHRLLRVRYSVFCCFCCMLFSAFSFFFAETATAAPVVRIGYILPSTPGLSPMQIRHAYVSYFDEIALQTGWQYEMICVDAEDSFDALEQKQIDLLLPAEYSPLRAAEHIIYSDTCCFDILGLYTRLSSADASDAYIYSLQHVNVGLLNDRQANASFEKFAAENQLSPNRRYFQTKSELLTALQAGEIDMFVDSDTNNFPREKLLVPFSVIPAHIAALDENQVYIYKLNQAMHAIHTENPGWEEAQKNALLPPIRRSITCFTTGEQHFIRSNPPLTVVFWGNYAPFRIFNEKEQECTGILPDIMRLLAEETGLTFQFVHTNTLEEAQQMLTAGTADIMLNIYHNDDSASQQFYNTNPILNEKFAFIRKSHEDFDLDDHLRLTLEQDAAVSSGYIHGQLPNMLLQPAASISECLEDVQEDRADIAIVSMLRFQINQSIFYPELQLLPTTELAIPISLSIARHQPRLLQSLLNKAILKTDPQKIDQIILKHTVDGTPKFTFHYAINHYPLEIAIIIFFLLLLVLLGTFLLYHNHINYRQKKLLAQKNQALQETIAALQETSLDRDSYKYVAETDPLTGLLNKAAIEAVCREAFLNPLHEKQQNTFFIVDLDHFKEANDTFGHQYGDKILKDFAQVLENIFRDEDAVGRFGGDEFIIFIQNASAPHTLHRMARQINTAARELDVHENHPMLSASIGIAIAPLHGESYEEIFQAADRALYHVKNTGRDNYCIYSSELED